MSVCGVPGAIYGYGYGYGTPGGRGNRVLLGPPERSSHRPRERGLEHKTYQPKRKSKTRHAGEHRCWCCHAPPFALAAVPVALVSSPPAAARWE
eukprot:6050690-Prymnesium_polylepis.2